MNSPPRTPAEFYEQAYSLSEADGVRFGEWRRITAIGKVERALRALSELPDAGVALLEVGCGDGAVMEGIAERRPRWTLAGAEVSAAAARITRERLPGVTVRTYDGGRLPWADASFDVGLLSHVVEHVAEPVVLLREVARVSRLVLIEVPLEHNLSAARRSKRELSEEIGHVRRLSRRAIGELIEQAGLVRRLELTATLSREALGYFATSDRARRRATIKWVVQRSLHRAAPALAERVFTVQYVALCTPRTR